MPGNLYYGDNLGVLREHVRDESVDLVYLDPPFNSNATYNVLFKAPSGQQSQAQIEAFEDTFHWGTEAESAFVDVLRNARCPDVGQMLESMRRFLHENDMMAYLAMMAARMIELHRVLKPTGSLYLHCDPTASHYLKVLLDAVFDPTNFRSEIVWKRSTAHSDGKQGRRIHGHIHDVLLFYTKSDSWTWNPIYSPYDDSYIRSHYSLIEQGTNRRFRADNLTAAKPGGDTSYDWRVKRQIDDPAGWQADLSEEFRQPKDDWVYDGIKPYKARYWAYSKLNMAEFEAAGRLYYTSSGMPNYKRYLDEMPGVPLQDLWTDISPINSQAQERLGYPTQKPLALLEQVIACSTNAGDIVLDPFCGCGTTIHAAEKLERNWIGIDITHLAISLIERRLRDAFPGVKFDVHGTPKDLEGARDLALRDKYQFQWWAVSLVDAVPYGGKKRGADSGIDGWRYMASGRNTVSKCIVSVKGGENVSVQMIRDLRGVMERDNAEAGLFITLARPTQPMIDEASKAKFFDSPFGGKQHPRLQIRTIEQLLNGLKPDLPPLAIEAGFRRAEKEDRTQQDQGSLLALSGIEAPAVMPVVRRGKRVARPVASGAN